MNDDAYRPQLTLFMREGCHLCVELEQLVVELLEPDSYRLRKVDIDDNETLRQSYNVRVPVLVCEEMEVCEHYLDLQALQNALAQAHASYNERSSEGESSTIEEHQRIG